MRFRAALAALLAGIAVPTAAADLTIAVDDVRNARGHVHVDVCPRDRFLKDDCPYTGEAAAEAGTTMIRIRGVPPGEYAIQAFHDENDNHRVDRALFGIPREGVAFSHDAPIVLGPPKWDAARFPVEGDALLRMRMRYFLKPSGSAPR